MKFNYLNIAQILLNIRLKYCPSLISVNCGQYLGHDGVVLQCWASRVRGDKSIRYLIKH
jgi:hypothetical protein